VFLPISGFSAELAKSASLLDHPLFLRFGISVLSTSPVFRNKPSEQDFTSQEAWDAGIQKDPIIPDPIPWV